jgi:hypothetical protein
MGSSIVKGIPSLVRGKRPCHGLLIITRLAYFAMFVYKLVYRGGVILNKQLKSLIPLAPFGKRREI